MSDGGMKRFSAAELRRARAEGRTQTDVARVRAQPDAAVARDAASDPDLRDLPADWHLRARAVHPKRAISIRLDEDLLAFFQRQGPGWQTRINAVLRAYAEATGAEPPGRVR